MFSKGCTLSVFFPLQNTVCFIMLPLGSCIIHILHTGCAKVKKQNSGAKGLINALSPRPLYAVHMFCVPFMNVNRDLSTASRDVGDRQVMSSAVNYCPVTTRLVPTIRRACVHCTRYQVLLKSHFCEPRYKRSRTSFLT
jgi:hypothetical protein